LAAGKLFGEALRIKLLGHMTNIIIKLTVQATPDCCGFGPRHGVALVKGQN